MALVLALALSARLPAQQVIFTNNFENDSFGTWSAAVGHVDHFWPLLVDQSAYYAGAPDECYPEDVVQDWDGPFDTIDPGSVGPGVTLDFVVEVHVEPFSTYITSESFYQTSRSNVLQMATNFFAHGAKLTLEVQPPFTDAVAGHADTILADVLALGHQIGLHFHEDAQLGANANTLPVEDWIAVLSTMKAQAETLSGGEVGSWSGGNLYPNALAASTGAGLSIKSGFKDPNTQSTAAAAVTVTPYFPGAWGSAEALLVGGGSDFLFVPTGVYPLHCTRVGAVDGPNSPAPFNYLTRAVAASLDAAQPLAAQAMTVVFHASGFTGSPAIRAQQIGLWNRYLTEVLDPLVAAGVLRFSRLEDVEAAVLAILP